MFLNELHRYGENTAWPSQGIEWGGGGGNWMLHLEIKIKTEMPWKFA